MSHVRNTVLVSALILHTGHLTRPPGSLILSAHARQMQTWPQGSIMTSRARSMHTMHVVSPPTVDSGGSARRVRRSPTSASVIDGTCCAAASAAAASAAAAAAAAPAAAPSAAAAAAASACAPCVCVCVCVAGARRCWIYLMISGKFRSPFTRYNLVGLSARWIGWVRKAPKSGDFWQTVWVCPTPARHGIQIAAGC